MDDTSLDGLSYAEAVGLLRDRPRPVRLRFRSPPFDGAAAMTRINALAEKGRLDDAARLLEELLAREQDASVDGWELRLLASNVYTALDRHTDALPALRQMLDTVLQQPEPDPELHARSRYLLAACLIRVAEAQEQQEAQPAPEAAAGYTGSVMQHATQQRWNLTQQAIGHLRTAVQANPQHGDAKYFLGLQLMKSARGFEEAAGLLGSIALSSPEDPRTVFDFSPVDVLLLSGQAHEKVGDLEAAAAAFHNAASWYAVAADEQWEVDNAQTFKFGLAYYNLARMLGLQSLWAEALKVVQQGLQYFPAVWHLIDMHGVSLDSLGRHEEAKKVFADAHEKMKEWPAEWRTMPTRVFGSTLAWLKLRRATGNGRAASTAPPPAASGSADGGWGAAGSGSAKFELDRCDIERRDASTLSVAAFLEEFADMNRPVLITGAMEGWAAWERWSREGLLERYHAQTVQVRRSSAIATDAEFGGQHAHNMTVREYVAGFMSAASAAGQCDAAGGCAGATDNGQEGEDPLYMFAQDPLMGLREDYGAPAFFEDRARYSFSEAERQRT